MPWSPVQMPVSREREFMSPAIIRKTGRGLSNVTSKRP
jgi:hypothetical protein